MKFSIMAGLLSLAMATSVAQAETYIAIEGSKLSVGNNISDSLEPSGLRFRLGSRVSDFFDVEAHLGMTGDHSHPQFDEFSTGYFGGYVKGYLPVGARSAVVGLAGFTRVKHTQTIDGTEFSDARGGFSWGLGVETQLSDRLDLTADYVSYLSDEGLFENISAINFGLKLYF